MKIIALLNQKGGVGKTTSTINIGAGLSILKKKVLLMDLDPQANLTYSLGIQAHDLDKTIFELLKGEVTIDQAIQTRQNNPKENLLYVIPANLNLSGAELELSGYPGREFLLRETINGAQGFDYVLIDCPPSLGLLTLNALTTAQEVFIPLQMEFLALAGISKLINTIEVVRKRLNKGIQISGIICNRYDQRKNLNKEVAEKIREHFGNKVFNTMIRDNIAIAEAPSYGKTIFEYRPESHGAEDYINLTREIIRREL